MEQGQLRGWQKALLLTAAVMIIIDATYNGVRGFRDGFRDCGCQERPARQTQDATKKN